MIDVSKPLTQTENQSEELQSQFDDCEVSGGISLADSNVAMQLNANSSRAENTSEDDEWPGNDEVEVGQSCMGGIKSSLGGICLRWCRLMKTIDVRGNQSSVLLQGSISGSSTFAYSKKNVYSKNILNCVSGEAYPGEVLALMGPSGAGKTTLLDALSGRSQLDSGLITVNSKNADKQVMDHLQRQLAYVKQSDIFFEHLTVRDQLTYTALLMLPSDWTRRRKHAEVNRIMFMLRLEKCADTPIQLVSGGEKKRTNIGTELLAQPKIIIMDEPSSGLDSASAVELMKMLQTLARKENKTVITSIHQPGSAVFHQFDKLLMMADGSVVFFGEPGDSVEYLEKFGYECPNGYNAADYWMEILVLDWESGRASCQDSTTFLGGNTNSGITRATSARAQRHQSIVPESLRTRGVKRWKDEAKSNTSSPTQRLIEAWDKERAAEEVTSAIEQEDGFYHKMTAADKTERNFRANWGMQFYVLMHRSLKNSHAAIFTPLNIIKSVCMGVIVGLVWFQRPYTEDYVRDRSSYLFFSLAYWVFEALFEALMAFPDEKQVVFKERASGCYRLSAYFMAKTTSDIPTRVLLPLMYMIISYWMAGINPSFIVFLGTTFVILLAVVAGESLGLLIGASVLDINRALAVMVVVSHALLIASGYFVEDVPSFIEWIKYLSCFHYAYDASRLLVFNRDVPCDGSGRLEFLCQEEGAGSASVGGVTKFIGVEGTLAFNICMLIVVTLIPRLGAFFMLKLHKAEER